MTLAFTCSKVEAGATLAADAFAPPEDVRGAEEGETPEAGGPAYRIVERPAQPVASIRVTCQPQEISATLAELLPEVLAHLNASGARMAGVPFSRYHAFGPSEIDIEAGIPVVKHVPEKGRVKNSELPGGKAVMVWHRGAYEKLAGAHEALQAYLASHDLKPRGGPWEVYWTDPGMVPDPAKWRTQIFAPISE
jgi:AraC family transcriptional regulator